MTNAPLSCGILIQHLHFSQIVFGILKNLNGNANVALWWEALHHRIDFFSYFMHAFNKYPETNN